MQLATELMWRTSNIAAWHSEPYVRQSILLNSYDTVQNHSYKFFQDNFTGAISSKLKGILDGYDKLWAEIHHGLLLKILRSTVSILALSIINLTLGMFMQVKKLDWWAVPAPESPL